MKPKYILLFAIILFVTDCFSQTIIISGEKTSRKLKWSDFSGKPDKSSGHYAYTWWNINYRTGQAEMKGDSIYFPNLVITLILDPDKSWRLKDKETDDLLKHEQGHFDVGILCMNELLEKMKGPFARGGQSGYQIVFNQTLAKYTQMGAKYDYETQHSRNKEEQKKWNEFFEENVKHD